MRLYAFPRRPASGLSGNVLTVPRRHETRGYRAVASEAETPAPRRATALRGGAFDGGARPAADCRSAALVRPAGPDQHEPGRPRTPRGASAAGLGLGRQTEGRWGGNGATRSSDP